MRLWQRVNQQTAVVGSWQVNTKTKGLENANENAEQRRDPGSKQKVAGKEDTGQ